MFASGFTAGYRLWPDSVGPILMIRRIEIVNFMSHARTLIEPADGLTVLVGPNNCGKSAVVAALQILCHNDNSTYVTRHDQKECSVTVETADRHIIVWRRNKNSPKYEIDGKPYDRLPRGGVPADLHAVLRMPKVSADGGQEFDVHFGEQKSPLFLIDKPGSHAAQFFASSSDAAKFVEMQKRHQTKLADARRDRAQEQAKADKLTTSLVALEPLETLGPGVLRLEQQHAGLVQSTATIQRLTSDLAALRLAQQEVRQFALKAVALSVLNVPPVLPDDAPLSRHLRDARWTIQECVAYSERAAALQPLARPPGIDEEYLLAAIVGELHAHTRAAEQAAAGCRATYSLTSPPLLDAAAELRQTFEAIVRQREILERVGRRAAALTDVTPTPTLDDLADLSGVLRAIVAAAADKRSLDETCRSFASLTVVPAVVSTADLQQCVRDINQAAASLQACRSAAAMETGNLKKCMITLREWAERQPACPTCGGPIDADRLIASSAATGVARA